MNDEIWLPITEAISIQSGRHTKGFFFEISNLGRVRNIETKELQVLLMNSYYLRFRGRLIHRLVSQAFIPNPKNKPEVNHINGVKTDNRVENLEWATISENRKHAYDTGLNKGNLGRKCSDESKLRMSEAKQGKKHSYETKKRIGEAHRGKKVSDETKNHLSEAASNRKCKLSDAQKNQIMILAVGGCTRVELAARFGVSCSTIKRLVTAT